MKQHESHDDADLRLVYKKEGERTVLTECFSRMPFRVFPPFYAQGHHCAYTYVVNPTPGFLAGDRLRVEITAEPGAHAFITGPSATKILKTGLDYVEQRTEIHLAQGAILEYLPPYVIPFGGSSYRQHTVVHIMEGPSTCLALDWFCTGRVSHGEWLKFDEYESSTTVFSEEQPVIRDRLVLRPNDHDYRSLGFLGSHNVCAFLFLVHSGSWLPQSLIDRIRDAIPAEGTLAGISDLDGKGLVVRITGESIYPVQRVLVRVVGLIRKDVFGFEDGGLPVRLLRAL